jgi:hypothetical protein
LLLVCFANHKEKISLESEPLKALQHQYTVKAIDESDSHALIKVENLAGVCGFAAQSNFVGVAIDNTRE